MVYLDLQRHSKASCRASTKTTITVATRNTVLYPIGNGFRNLPSLSGPDTETADEVESNRIAIRYSRHFEEVMRESGGPWSRLVLHPRFEKFGGCIVLINFMVMTMETHATATADDWVLSFVNIANRILLLYYTAELLLRLYVMRMIFFAAGWNILDLIIVVTGWISEMLEALNVSAGMMDQITMLKSLRMLRLLRLLRLFVAFGELYVLLAGIGRCMKTLFWASGLIFIVLNVWAILSVEFLNQKVKELIPSGVYQTCGWCDTAFDNIWYANLTWFQIISTADWSAIGRPLAEEFFWPYVFFVLIVFIVIWGLLNLIVAAIVDANIAAREDDYAAAAKLADQSYNQAFLSFQSICRDMDVDGSGDISVQEFKNFLRENNELKQYLSVMGIRTEDVKDLLKLMDVDENGSLSCEEFIEQFALLRTLVDKTSLYLLLKMSHQIAEKLAKQCKDIQSLHADLSEVKRSCVRAQTSRELDLPNSTLAASQSYSQTREVGPAGRQAALRTLGHTLRATAKSKMLPPGWYYFGASLPPEASFWCKTIDPTGEPGNSFRACDDPKEAAVCKDASSWEPILSNNISVVRAPDPSWFRTDPIYRTKHTDVRTPHGELPCHFTGSTEPSNLQGGATSVRRPQAPPESATQDVDGLECFFGKPASDHKSLEHARHIKFESPRCSTRIDEPEHQHRLTEFV